MKKLSIMRKALIKSELKKLRLNGDFKDWVTFCDHYNVLVYEVKAIAKELEAEGF